MSDSTVKKRVINLPYRLLKDAEICDDKKLLDLSEELLKILTSIVKTGYEKNKPKIQN